MSVSRPHRLLLMTQFLFSHLPMAFLNRHQTTNNFLKHNHSLIFFSRLKIKCHKHTQDRNNMSAAVQRFLSQKMVLQRQQHTRAHIHVDTHTRTHTCTHTLAHTHTPSSTHLPIQNQQNFHDKEQKVTQAQHFSGAACPIKNIFTFVNKFYNP